MVDIRRLDAPFGAEIRGLDLRQGASAEVMRALTDALYAHRVVVIREQSFDEDSYLAFGRGWGTPIPHVLDHMRMPGYPELLTVGNTEQRDQAPAIRNGAALWHTDQSYEAVPASATMLYSIKAPRQGGQTQFCDMAAAYAALDEGLKRELDGLEVAHKYGRGTRRVDDYAVNPLINDEQDSKVPVIYHPLVLHHPITSVPALYALGHGAHAIKGWSDERAEELLERLKDHALDERFIYRHPYAVGDLVIWDTLQTLHRATPIEVATGEADARLLWRISVRGVPEVLSGAPAGA